MVDYLQEAQRNSKLINTNTRLAQTNLINKLQTLGVTDADSSMNLPKLASMIGLVAGDGKMPCNLSLTADKTEVVVGESVTLTVSLTDVNGNAIPGETVSVLDENDTVLYTGIIELNSKNILITNENVISKTFHSLLKSKPLNYLPIMNSKLTLNWNKAHSILTCEIQSTSLQGCLKGEIGNPISNVTVNVTGKITYSETNVKYFNYDITTDKDGCFAAYPSIYTSYYDVSFSGNSNYYGLTLNRIYV